MTRKTAKMQLLEHKYGEQLETLMPRLYEELRTHTAVAVRLDVSVPTLLNWLNRMGATWERRATPAKRRTAVSIPTATEGR